MICIKMTVNEDFVRYSHIMKDLEKCINQCDKCKELEVKNSEFLIQAG